MLNRITISIFVGIGCLAFAANAPERKVENNNVIISERDPKVRIELPKSVQYVGADRWVLYDIADCELHAFVEADKHQNVQRLYWIQFESYLPSKPDLHHTYDSPRHATIGGLDFYVDTWVKLTNEKITPGSDEEHIQTLIHRKGFKLPARMMSVRLVHLLDEPKRKELMFIYAEDVAPTGFAAADLKKGGRAHDQGPAIEKSLIERAERKIKIEL
ncbi:MAG TPA: hypothetical protein VNY07_06400 [Chthoniobacterales bacterium]|nr:hypothetical protein [Chthoniobacterales bacterium]